VRIGSYRFRDPAPTSRDDRCAGAVVNQSVVANVRVILVFWADSAQTSTEQGVAPLKASGSRMRNDEATPTAWRHTVGHSYTMWGECGAKLAPNHPLLLFMPMRKPHSERISSLRIIKSLLPERRAENPRAQGTIKCCGAIRPASDEGFARPASIRCVQESLQIAAWGNLQFDLGQLWGQKTAPGAAADSLSTMDK
jgi:hypothetical protein